MGVAVWLGWGRWKMTNMFSSAMMPSILMLAFTTMVVEGKELERFSRKGKVVSEEADGNIAIELRRKRWQGEKERSLCCALAGHHCKGPCIGAACTAQCTVSCGFLAFWKCPPLTCSSANPSGCTAATSCGTGGTQVGSKCFTFNSTPQTWLAALTTCLTAGGNLAKIESAAEQTAAYALTGGVNTWIGLNDIGTEGMFTWADDSALGSYTNWNAGEPDSTAAAPAVQHCVNLRAADGFWNDVLCGSARAFICQT